MCLKDLPLFHYKYIKNILSFIFISRNRSLAAVDFNATLRGGSGVFE